MKKIFRLLTLTFALLLVGCSSNHAETDNSSSYSSSSSKISPSSTSEEKEKQEKERKEKEIQEAQKQKQEEEKKAREEQARKEAEAKQIAEAADQAVQQLENNPVQENISSAQAAVEHVADPATKASLTERIVQVQNTINQRINGQRKLAKKLRDKQQNSNKQELFMSLDSGKQMFIGIAWRICHPIHVLIGS
jgi:putative lipoprotein